MKVISVNTGKIRELEYRGKRILTGYFKHPVQRIVLRACGVEEDGVADTVHHGGPDKACYIFGFSHYEFWKKHYPTLEGDAGLFGENITLDKLDEAQVKIGDTFEAGEAIVQVTQPRQPCYKMELMFKDPDIVQKFRLAPSPGIYVRVLREGVVVPGDSFTLIKSNPDAPTVLETFRMIYAGSPSPEAVERLINTESLATRLKETLRNKFLRD
ncbi:MAG: MOSC domain-containing protein [Bacteroidia bacterium]|nr:MOSC domain-containing protein [Bacteroidia bacterium]